MSLDYLRAVKKKSLLLSHRIGNWGKEQFECPICSYRGPFEDVTPGTGIRKHAKCPQCYSLERHRHQYLVIQAVLDGLDTLQMKMLHFAPEECLKKLFVKRFGTYETADLNMAEVDHKVDIQNLPFADSTYDFIFASHVMVCIPDDRQAAREIRRVLKNTGMAILHDPVAAEKTIEYPEPNPYEGYGRRAPGLDYADRYWSYFSRVVRYSSSSWPEKYQLYEYEDRTGFPTVECPLRPSMAGEKHSDMVTVCYA